MSGHIRGDVRKRLNHSVSHWNPATAELIDQARAEAWEDGFLAAQDGKHQQADNPYRDAS
jgi:hypothetical protein